MAVDPPESAAAMAAAAALLPPAAEPDNEILRQIDELENQVRHLRRSNAELEEHMRENGNDHELRAAVGENIVAIAKRCAIIEDLQKLVPVKPAAGGQEAGVFL